MRRINKLRLMNNLELINTKSKYILYAIDNNLPTEINPNNFSHNWIKFLRLDYNEFIQQHYVTDELKELNKINDSIYIYNMTYIISPLLRFTTLKTKKDFKIFIYYFKKLKYKNTRQLSINISLNII